MTDDSFELIRQTGAGAILEAHAARNAQVMPDPTRACWQTREGGEWQVGTRLYLNQDSVQSIPALPKRSHHAEETTTYLPAVQSAALPKVVTIAVLPGCNEHGIFNPVWPMELRPDDGTPAIALRGMEAQFFYRPRILGR